MARPPALAALALAAVALLAVPGALAAPTSGSKVVEPGAFFERDLSLAAGARVAWNITLAPEGARASYNIHSHLPDGSAQDHESGPVNGSAEGVFTAPHTGAFSWMVLNGLSREPLTATITTEELAAARPAPSGDAALLAGGLSLAAWVGRRGR